jgi:hypothetical protein
VYGNVSSTLKQLIIGAMPASDPATFSAVNDNQAVSVCAKTNRGDLKDIQRFFFFLPPNISGRASPYILLPWLLLSARDE